MGKGEESREVVVRRKKMNKNVLFNMVVTLDTSHFEMSELNASAAVRTSPPKAAVA